MTTKTTKTVTEQAFDYCKVARNWAVGSFKSGGQSGYWYRRAASIGPERAAAEMKEKYENNPFPRYVGADWRKIAEALAAGRDALS